MTRELEALRQYNEAKLSEIKDVAAKEKARILMDKYPDKMLNIADIPDYVDVDLLIAHLENSRRRNSFYIGMFIKAYFEIICNENR